MSSESGTAAEELPEPPILPKLDGEGVHLVREVLAGLDEREVWARICGDIDGKALLESACVLCFRGDGYPRVDDHTGHILVPDVYPRNHPPAVVYLDLVHELVHVRQVMEGKRVYHFPEPYVRWPTEVEAYRITYEEAKRLGISDDWFWRYLAVPWVEDDELGELARAIGMPETHAGGGAEQGARH